MVRSVAFPILGLYHGAVPRAQPKDPRLVKASSELQIATGDLIRQLRIQRGMTLIELGAAIAKVGGQFHWTRPNVLSDVEAGRRPITLEDIVMAARALSTKATKDHGEVHPLQLTPWVGASSKLLTQEQAAEIEVRLMTERVAWREAKLKKAAAEFAVLVGDLGFRTAIADLAALSQDDRRVMQRILRGLRGGEIRRPVGPDMRPVGEPEFQKERQAQSGAEVVPGKPHQREGLALDPTEAVGTRSQLAADVDWPAAVERLRTALKFAEDQARESRSNTSRGGSAKR